MADFEPPSFSLGLDFDLDSPPPSSSTNPISSITESAGVDCDFDIHATGRALKRLRRGPGPGPRTGSESRYTNGDDDIEEFSSQEDPYIANKPPSLHPYSGGSTSKFSLTGHKVLTSQPNSKCNPIKKEPGTDVPISTSMKNSNRFTFSKLTVSPLRKFQLLDSESEKSESDSDSDSGSEFDDPSYMAANKVNSSSKAKVHNSAENPTLSGQKRANVDLWKDFHSEKRFSIPTPALDEVCEEYFKSAKNNQTNPCGSNVGKCSREINNCVQTHIVIDDDGVHCELDDHVAPSHDYFFHDDPRVRDLVRSRLPHFFPLGATNGRNPSTVPSMIDYRDQFNHGSSSKPKAPPKTNPGTNSKRVKKNLSKSNIEEVPESSGRWVNPRSSGNIPTDAGKRRVHAVGSQSSGHWFTSPEGKKVYISKSGQELSGRAAYTHYRKESGKGFKKSRGKKKGAGKKKNAANKR